MKNLVMFALVLSLQASASELQLGEFAPDFKLPQQDGKEFSLQSRKGHWTVLYFYPKSETPGCTKQACAFRDQSKKIRTLGAEIIGVSVNSVKDQMEFSKKHRLDFTLLADADGKVTEKYGAKMPFVTMAKRWTFILDPKLVVRSIEKNVDPVKDASRVERQLNELQASP